MYRVIGQGLAGSLLAWQLIQQGYRVIIIDNGKENASQVAAGLINPVTGLRFVKTADVDILLPAAKHCYSGLAEFFQQVFYYEKPMLRIFRSEQEFIYGLKRQANPGYYGYLGDIIQARDSIVNLATPFGFLEQKQTGYLLTRPLLKCLKEFFISQDCYRQAEFDYRDIQLTPCLRWQAIYPKQIIFCEGHHALQNPWFSWLPFRPVKGEILTLEHASQLPDHIVNNGHWLIPLNSRHLRIGATFDRDNLNTQITDQGKAELLKALGRIAPALTQTALINHQANIRPCTDDRQPFIGFHPLHRQLAIFNGFGAKGSLQIPWYSQRFIDALLNKGLLPSSIERYYATHFTA